MWAAPGDTCGLKALWTDAPDASDQLRQRVAAGLLSPAEHADFVHFIDHGWLVWRNAIAPDLVDAFVDDIHSLHRHPDRFVMTDLRGSAGKPRHYGTVPNRFESIYDLYVNLPSARAVCFHPRIVRFLLQAFKTRPVAMQQLLFQRSNGHRFHQDTSVVAVDDPLLLIASWIALEDVVEGSGELAFYDRSHRLPHYLFANGTKRMTSGVDDEMAYVQALDDACREAGLEYHRFKAKKGDVFLWTADLVHRSHPRTLPNDTSRLSCVTHYYPATSQPFWFRLHPDRRTIRSVDSVAGYASYHYDLSEERDGMISPGMPSIPATTPPPNPRHTARG